MKKIRPKSSKKKAKSKTPQKFWWETSLFHVGNKDAVQSALFKLGSTGLTEEAESLIAYFEPEQFADPDKLAELLHHATQCRVEIKKIPAQDWESEWKKNFKPRKISKRFVVRPSWEKYTKKKNELILVIDPKMSFGTGTHETTQLVIQLMESHFVKGNVLDIGTGTGILAIAASKLGGKKIYAFDVDENSYENASENFRRNRCEKKISMFHGAIDRKPKSWPEKFDMILANIQKSVILDMLETIRLLMAHRGVLLVSGILTSEDPILREEFERHGFKLIESKQDGEWVAYALTHEPGLYV